MPSSILHDISEVLLDANLSDVSEYERSIFRQSMVQAKGAIIRVLGYDPVQQTRTEFYPRMDIVGNRAVPEIWEVSDTQAYLRYERGAGGDQLQLQHLPVRSVTALYIDEDARNGTRAGSFAASTARTEGVDFWPNYEQDNNGVKICRDGLLQSVGAWPISPGSVKIVYVAGYTDDEFRGNSIHVDASPIWEAIVDETIRRGVKKFSRGKKGRVGFTGAGFTSERLGDYSYSLDGATMQKYLSGGDVMGETMEKLQPFVNYGWYMGG